MKKNQWAAIIIGAVLITGSTVSISAASMSKNHHKSHAIKAKAASGFLRGVVQGNSWAALHAVLNAHANVETPVVPIVAPPGLLPSDTTTAGVEADEDGIVQEDATENEDLAGVNDDDASPIIGVTAPTLDPNAPTGIANPMTKSHDGANEHSDQSEGDSNQSQGDSND
jgi:hypothetical protein